MLWLLQNKNLPNIIKTSSWSYHLTIRVATMLDIPVQTYVSKISINERAVEITRTIEDGIKRVEVPLPVLLSVVNPGKIVDVA